MAWPPPVLPINRTNADPQQDTHPNDHNAANLAINDLVNQFTVVAQIHGVSAWTTGQTLQPYTMTDIVWTAESIDSDNFVTPPSADITVGLTAVYSISIEAFIPAATAYTNQLQFTVDGTVKTGVVGVAGGARMTLTYVFYLDAGRTVKVQGLHGDPAAATWSASIQMWRLRP